MDIGWAVEALLDGQRVVREGWNGKDMFLYLIPRFTVAVNQAPLNKVYEKGTEVEYQAQVIMKTAQGDHVPWLCSQSDLLADDWDVVS